MNITTKIEHLQAQRDKLPEFSEEWCVVDDKIHEVACNAAAKREAALRQQYKAQIAALTPEIIAGARFSDALDLVLAAEEECTCHQDPDRPACSSCRARDALRFDTMPW